MYFCHMKKTNIEKHMIGNVIRQKVKEKGWSAREFAEKICCSEKNVYKIFNKNSMDIDLLGRISKILNHNFFQDISENLDLASALPEEQERQRSILQFLDVVPSILNRYQFQREKICLLAEESNEIPTPDYMLEIEGMVFVFCYGKTYEERIKENEKYASLFSYSKNSRFTILVSKIGDKICDIPLVYKTEKEWEDTLLSAINAMKQHFVI